jgi:hypothetical protein
MQPTAYPVQMAGYDLAQQTAGIPQGASQAPVPQGMQERGRPVSEQDAWNTLTPEQKMQVQGLPGEAQAAFLAQIMGNFGQEATDADRDMSRADALRGDQRATGQTVGPDNIYVGASGLEHAADAIRGYQGMRDFKEAKGARTDARADDQQKREAIGEQMFARSGALRGMFE